MCAFNICLFLHAFIVGTRLGFINFKIMKINKKLIDKWACWKDDIYENNKSTWTTDDDKLLLIINELIQERK